MSFHDLIDHGLTALMPTRARVQHITGAGFRIAWMEVGGAALLVGGVGTVLVGGGMHLAHQPQASTVMRVGAVLTVPPLILFGGAALKRHLAAQPTVASAPTSPTPGAAKP